VLPVFRISVTVSARANVAEVSVTSAKIASETAILLTFVSRDIVKLLPAFSVRRQLSVEKEVPSHAESTLFVNARGLGGSTAVEAGIKPLV
jgi:hypothetical protein